MSSNSAAVVNNSSAIAASEAMQSEKKREYSISEGNAAHSPRIDPEFKGLIPESSQEEKNQLRENISFNGCLDTLKVWEGTNILLDGHNRLEICKELKIPYEIQEIPLKSREDAINWIIDNQLGRRNLTDTQRSYLRGKRYRTEKKVVGAPIGNLNAEKQIGHNGPIVSTAQKIANQTGVSENTIKRDAKLSEAIDQIRENSGNEVAQKILNEDIKATKKDVLAVGHVLDEGAPAQKEQIVSELKDDFRKATETAKEIAIRAKIPEPTPLPPDLRAALDKCVSEIGTKPPVSPIWTNSSDHDHIMMVADEMYCPKCTKKARLVLKWVCCNLSIEEATGLAQKAMDEHIKRADEKFRARQQAKAEAGGSQCQ